MFFLLGIGAYTKFSDLKDTSHCRDLGPLKDAQFLIDESQEMLCGEHCNCLVSEGWLWDHLGDRFQTSYDVNGTIAVSNIQSCQYFNDTMIYDVKLLKSLQWLENTYQCSGICSASSMYLFSNLNSQYPPQQSCMTIIQDEARKMAQIFGGLALTSALLLFILLIEIVVLFAEDKKLKRNMNVKRQGLKLQQSPDKERIFKKQLLKDHSSMKVKAKNMQVLEFD